MATVAQVSSERKRQLKLLMLASRRLDASQESLEREVKRLINRKAKVPEVKDAERLTQLAISVDKDLGNMTQVISSLASSWSSL